MLDGAEEKCEMMLSVGTKPQRVVVLWCCGAVVLLSASHHSTAHRSTDAAAVVKFNRNSNFIGNALLHPAAARMAGVSAQYRIGRVYWLATVH